MDDNFIGVGEASEISGIKYETIYAAAKQGRITGAKQLRINNAWVFPRQAFAMWAENHKPYNTTRKKQEAVPA